MTSKHNAGDNKANCKLSLPGTYVLSFIENGLHAREMGHDTYMVNVITARMFVRYAYAAIDIALREGVDIVNAEPVLDPIRIHRQVRDVECQLLRVRYRPPCL